MSDTSVTRLAAENIGVVADELAKWVERLRKSPGQRTVRFAIAALEVSISGLRDTRDVLLDAPDRETPS